MEYVQGTPLDEYIEQISGPIHELRAIEIFTKILDAISYIHKKYCTQRY